MNTAATWTARDLHDDRSPATLRVTAPMVPIRPIVVCFVFAALCGMATDRAEAAVLLPDLASITHEEPAEGMSVSAETIPVLPENDVPPTTPIGATNSAPAIPATGASGPAGGSGGSGVALPSAASVVVGNDLVERLQLATAPGWGFLQWGGIFRPPRSAA